MNVLSSCNKLDMQLIIEEEEIQTISETQYVTESSEQREVTSARPTPAGVMSVTANLSQKETDILEIPEVVSTFASWHIICGVVLASAQLLYSAILKKNDRRR